MEEELKEIREIALNNAKKLEEHTKRIDINFEKATNNSIALDILKEFKEEIKQLHTEKEKSHSIARLSVIGLIIVICLWAVTIGGLIYVLKDVGRTEETIEIDGVEQIDNSHIKIGDDIWEKSE